MGLIDLLIVLIVFGVLFYILQNYIPMAQPFKTAVILVLAIIFVVYLLDGHHLGHLRWIK